MKKVLALTITAGLLATGPALAKSMTEGPKLAKPNPCENIPDAFGKYQQALTAFSEKFSNHLEKKVIAGREFPVQDALGKIIDHDVRNKVNDYISKATEAWHRLRGNKTPPAKAACNNNAKIVTKAVEVLENWTDNGDVNLDDIV